MWKWQGLPRRAGGLSLSLTHSEGSGGGYEAKVSCMADVR